MYTVHVFFFLFRANFSYNFMCEESKLIVLFLKSMQFVEDKPEWTPQKLQKQSHFR